MMAADPTWFANDVAMGAAIVSGVALVASCLSVWYSRQQARAGSRQAEAGEEAVRLQARALKTSVDDTANALSIAAKNSDAAKASANALTAQAQDTHEALAIAARSAAAAERLAEVNEMLTVSGLRGWLVLISAKPTLNHSPTRITIRAKFTFKNVGKVPISGIWFRRCERVVAEEPKLHDFAGLTGAYYPAKAPEEITEIESVIECSPAEYSEIASKQKKALFFGNVGYQDVFASYTTYWRWEFSAEGSVVIATCHCGHSTNNGAILCPGIVFRPFQTRRGLLRNQRDAHFGHRGVYEQRER